jgi:hypothetical protein
LAHAAVCYITHAVTCSKQRTCRRCGICCACVLCLPSLTNSAVAQHDLVLQPTPWRLIAFLRLATKRLQQLFGMGPRCTAQPCFNT